MSKEKELTILLVEDDLTECKAISNYVGELEGVRLVGITNNASRAIEYTTECQPDAVILNLELYDDIGNGIAYLEQLKALAVKKTPYILVTTSNNSQTAQKTARQLGADFIMTKGLDDYSANSVVDFLVSLRDVIQSSEKLNGAHLAKIEAENSEQRTKNLLRKIHTELENVTISPKAVGRKYLIDAIMYIITNGPTANICPKISVLYGKSDASVERAMQNAINCAWRNSGVRDLTKHYTALINSSKGIPTITEFIHYYAEKIKHDF